MLSEQDVEGPIPTERSTKSDHIKFKAQLLENPESKSQATGIVDLGQVMSSRWSNAAYQLKDGEEHLYSTEVTAQCLAMSCLSHAITVADEGCKRHLQPICEKFALETGCP